VKKASRSILCIILADLQLPFWKNLVTDLSVISEENCVSEGSVGGSAFYFTSISFLFLFSWFSNDGCCGSS
jgi:hypothetical protein